MADPNQYHGYHQYHNYANTQGQQQQQQPPPQQYYANPQMITSNQQTSYYPSHALDHSHFQGHLPQFYQPTPQHDYYQQNAQAYMHNGHFAAQLHQAAYEQQQPSYPTPPIHAVPSDTIIVMRPEPEPELEPELEPEPAPPRVPSPEYELVLMSMVDEYLNAAYSLAVGAAGNDGGKLESYDKLIVAALACMDVVLKRWRLQPLLEAKLRLKYAKVLIEETQNEYETETCLTRGIDLAKENRLWDLQYTMQVLLAKVQYRLKPKAALKAIDAITEDVEAYQHTQWIYIFRFLRMTLSSASTSNTELQASASNLQKIQALARRNGDHAILVWSAAMEALIHLKGHNSEALDHAHRALAAARQMQLDERMTNSPQIQIMIQLIDVCCSLQTWNFAQVQKQTLAMQQMMDKVVDDPSWLTDGAILIPISKRSTAGLACLSNELVCERDGSQFISISWLTKQDVYCIGYLVSAVGIFHKNATDGHKAEKFLREGLGLIRKCLEKPEPVHGSLAYTEKHANARRMLECHFLLQLCFLYCARGKYANARAYLDDVQKICEGVSEPLPLDIRSQIKYLDGTIHHATGDLDRALAFYNDPDLKVSTSSSKLPHSRVHFDICLLAAMNTVLIIRSPQHPHHTQLPERMGQLSALAPTSYSKHIQAAYNLILAASPDVGQLQLKDYLSRSLNLAKEINNYQVTSITLGMMSWKWFRGVVGEQAEKGAMAMHAMAKKSGSGLWTSVADGMLSDTLERMGKVAQAESSDREGMDLFEELPEKVKASVGR